MPAFMITFVRIHDVAAYQREYLSQAHPILLRHGGVPVVVSDQVDVLGGRFPEGRVVVIEFPSAAQARAFYDDPGHEALKPALARYATHDSAIVDAGP